MNNDLLDLTGRIAVLRGGPGSGNWGHGGRPGKRGGSGGGGGLRTIGAKPGSSHEERRQASAKHREGRKEGSNKQEGTASRKFVDADSSPDFAENIGKHYESFHGKLNESERESISGYTDWEFEEINGSLRKGKVSSETAAKIKKLDDIMDKAPPVPEDLMTYRAIDIVPKGLVEGGSYSDKAFMSTALSGETVKGNFANPKGGAVFRIKVPKGSKGLYVGDVSGWDEQELILPRSSKFTVDKIGKEGKTTVIDVTLE